MAKQSYSIVGLVKSSQVTLVLLAGRDLRGFVVTS